MERKIIRLGQASSERSQAGYVYKRTGMFVTLIAGTHGYAMGYVLRKYEKEINSKRPDGQYARPHI